MQMTGRKIIAESMISLGIDTIFTVPGGHFLPTYNELCESPDVKVVVARHEQGAGYMATGHALTTGKPGIVFSGAPGPGATNLVTAVANAQADSIPLVVVTGQVDDRYVNRNALQYADNVSLFSPFTKDSRQARTVQEVPQLLRNAYDLANTGRPGPVHVAIPQNLQAQSADVAFASPNLAADDVVLAAESIAAVADGLRNATRPVVIAGHGVVRSRASASLVAVSESLSAPVVTSRSGIGAIPTSHPSAVGMLGFYGKPEAKKVVGEADFVLIVGCAMGEQTTYGWSPELISSDATVVQIDIDPAQLSRNYPADIAMLADCRTFLRTLADVLGAKNGSSEGDLRGATAATGGAETPSPGSDAVVQPWMVVDELERVAAKDAIVTADIGNHRLWLCDGLTVERPDGFLQSCEFDAMGFSLPAAIGAAFAERGRRAVAVAGDGGFVHTMGELAVAREHDLQVGLIIFVDGALGILKHQADEMYGRDMVDSLSPIDFCGIASAFSIPSRSVRTPGELSDALRWMMDESGPSVVVVEVDPETVFPALQTKIEQRRRDLLGQS